MLFFKKKFKKIKQKFAAIKLEKKEKIEKPEKVLKTTPEAGLRQRTDAAPPAEEIKEKPELGKREEKVEKVEEAPKPEVKGTPEVEKKSKIEKKVEKKSAQLGAKIIGIAPHVLVRPIITEKATFSEARGVYTFEIASSANKISVKKAVKELYDVEPVKVNIIRTKGKQVRYGRTSGRTKLRKKAMVYLKKEDKIEFAKK